MAEGGVTTSGELAASTSCYNISTKTTGSITSIGLVVRGCVIISAVSCVHARALV